MIDISTIRIRDMSADDPVSLAVAFADMNKMQEQFERYWQENLDEKRLTLIAEHEDRIVGYANLIWEPEYEPFRTQGIPEINDMNTVTMLRRNGIGSRMIASAEEIVRSRGKRIIGIGVGVTPDYAIAQSLYPNLGYIPDGTGVHPDKWGGCIYSTKKLY
jgi:GNAT superfamily N-acetyltransferase